MPTLQQGHIVWAEVRDPAGGNPKRRPVVIVTANAEIVRDAPLVAAAITTRLDESLPPHHVELPWQHGGHPKTGLRQRCVAVCNWLVEISPGDVVDIAGVVPTKTLLRIVEQIDRLRPPNP